MNIYISITILIWSIIILGTLLFIMTRIMINDRHKYEEQMAIAQAQSSMTKTKPFEDLKTFLNQMIEFRVVTEVINKSYDQKEPDELSILIAAIIESISTYTEINVSDEFKRQWLTYATEDYLTDYISQCTKVLTIKAIEDRKRASKISPTMEKPQPNTKKEEEGS